MKRSLVGLLAAAALFGVATGYAEARKATNSERQAMLDVWNAEYRTYVDDPPACDNTWITRVSAYRPRIGMIWANFAQRKRYDCTLGDGWVLLRRPTATSERWRIVTQGSDPPPCSYVTPRMARELGFGGCQP
jgi:hypothetical protein